MHHHSDIQDGISLKNPQFKGRAAEIASMAGIEIHILSDGTHTLAQLAYEGMAIATGHAKRRLGDQKDTELGIALALSRVFHAASKVYSHKASHLLAPPAEEQSALDDLPEELRSMLGLPNRQEEEAIARMDKVTAESKREQHNDKRRDARINWYMENHPEADKADVEWWLSETFGDTKGI